MKQPAAFAFLALPVLLSSAGAETAMLDCVADAPYTGGAQAVEYRLADGMVVNFEWQTVARWRITKATLLVHIARGLSPVHLDIALAPDRLPLIPLQKLKFLAQKVEPHPDGWIAIDVPPTLVEIAAGAKTRGIVVRDYARAKERWLHSRRSGQYGPHLLVEGVPLK
jgi:hypothetical protein